MSLYLVTGGAGFIGSHLAEELVRRGERVRVVDNLVTGKRQNLAHLPDVAFVEGDLADLATARAAVEDSEKKLLRAGADRVISPYFFFGYPTVWASMTFCSGRSFIVTGTRPLRGRPVG